MNVNALSVRCYDLIADGCSDADLAAVIAMTCASTVSLEDAALFLENVLSFKSLNAIAGADLVGESESLIASIAMQGLRTDAVNGCR
jgi:hypothetical protein